MDGFFINNFPFLLVLMSLHLFFELVRIHKIMDRWEIEALMIIPLSLIILYLWVGFYHPSIEASRLALRLVLAGSLGISIKVVSSYNKVIRQGRET